MILSETPTIQVNGKVLATAKIDAEVQYHPAETRRQAMVQAAQTLIIGELLKQRAVALELAEDEDKTDAEQQALFDALFDREVYIPAVTAEECQRYYEANREKFASAPLLELRHVLIAADPADPNERAEAETIAQGLLDQIQSGELSFEQALMHSKCPSAATQGHLGQISKDQTVPEFERQVFAAEEGLMPRPVESRYGFHIVDIVRKIAGRQLPFEQVQAKITVYLEDKVRRKATAQYIQMLITDAEIKGFRFDFDKSPLVQ